MTGVALSTAFREQGVLIYLTLSYMSQVQPTQVDYRSGSDIQTVGTPC